MHKKELSQYDLLFSVYTRQEGVADIGEYYEWGKGNIGLQFLSC